MTVYREQAPGGILAGWIECCWYLESNTAVTRYSVPPDGCIDILYDRANGLRAIGSMTAKQSFDLAEGAYLTGIRFRPGLARPFLGISAAELTDGFAPLDDLFPRRARELMRKLDDAPSIQEAMRRMQAEFQAPAHPEFCTACDFRNGRSQRKGLSRNSGESRTFEPASIPPPLPGRERSYAQVPQPYLEIPARSPLCEQNGEAGLGANRGRSWIF